MAQAVLNPGIALLTEDSPRYQLFQRLYSGMREAGQVEAPDYSDIQPYVLDAGGNPIPDGDGFLIDTDKVALINNGLAEYTDITTQNAAYMLSDAFMSVVMGGGGSGDGGSVLGDYLPIGGGMMSGALFARHGFTAGVNGATVLEIASQDGSFITNLTGNLKVDGDKGEFTGYVDSLGGYYINGQKVMGYDAGTLTIYSGGDIVLDGDTKVNGDFSFNGDIGVWDIVINEDGIFKDGLEYYYAGNSNKSDVDWTADTLTAEYIVDHGALKVDGLALLKGGFHISTEGETLSDSATEYDGDDNLVRAWTRFYKDVELLRGADLMYDGKYVLWPKTDDILSIGAPGKTLNLGDGYGGENTTKISLQADIWDYSNTYKLISKEGAGYFPNGLNVQGGTSGSSVLQTYYRDAVDQGVVFPHYLRMNSDTGPGLHTDSDYELSLDILFNVPGSGSPQNITSTLSLGPTTSRWRNLSITDSATLFSDTDAEFFAFLKPVEAAEFHIVSDTYKTALRENHLYFSDGVYIEGVVDGLRYSGNGYFLGDISSQVFTSGFAGTGWAVMTDKSYGGWRITTDYLTVRKKMRVYELEVQKISVTNGSLWVSDSCSGDTVEEVLETA